MVDHSDSPSHSYSEKSASPPPYEPEKEALLDAGWQYISGKYPYWTRTEPSTGWLQYGISNFNGNKTPIELDCFFTCKMQPRNSADLSEIAERCSIIVEKLKRHRDLDSPQSTCDFEAVRRCSSGLIRKFSSRGFSAWRTRRHMSLHDRICSCGCFDTKKTVQASLSSHKDKAKPAKQQKTKPSVTWQYKYGPDCSSCWVRTNPSNGLPQYGMSRSTDKTPKVYVPDYIYTCQMQTQDKTKEHELAIICERAMGSFRQLVGSDYPTDTQRLHLVAFPSTSGWKKTPDSKAKPRAAFLQAREEHNKLCGCSFLASKTKVIYA